MGRKILGIGGVFLFVGLASGLGQETPSAGGIPAASLSNSECSGFVSGTPLDNNIYVFSGADNDSRMLDRQIRNSHYVYLRTRKGENLTQGIEYRLVRRAREKFFEGWFASGLTPIRMFGRASWYPEQDASIRSLGHPYEDVARVKVTTVTPQGAVAEVTFACGPVNANDIAIPYQVRPVPSLVPGAQLDRFAVLPKDKQLGAITAAANNAGMLGNGSLAYVNLGESDGVHAGQRLRIFHIDRYVVEGWWAAAQDTPVETVGEMIILSTQERSSVAIIVRAIREISLGDGIVQE